MADKGILKCFCVINYHHYDNHFLFFILQKLLYKISALMH